MDVCPHTFLEVEHFNNSTDALQEILLNKQENNERLRARAAYCLGGVSFTG